MNKWIYHTPSDDDEVGPGYAPGMECEYIFDGGWCEAEPYWNHNQTYRYRWPTANKAARQSVAQKGRA